MDLLVLDGNSILNRAFYGIKLLSTKNGFHTNAIYGFLNILNKLKDHFNPKITTIAFDLNAPTFRHELYVDYKANRKRMPEELAEQVPVLKKLLKYLGYKIIEKESFEADDILGTLSYMCEKSGMSCLLATGDRDLLQLVSQHTSVYIASTKTKSIDESTYNEEKILEEYGVNPQQLIEVKALMGDKSDNIPGIKGIGPKIALSLVNKYGNIDNLYSNIESVSIGNNLRVKLKNGKDSAYISRKLGTIIRDVPIPKEISFYKNVDIATAEAVKLLEELEMFTVIKKLKTSKKSDTELHRTTAPEKETEETFQVICAEDHELEKIATETKSQETIHFAVDFHDEEIHTLYILLENQRLFVIKNKNEKFLKFTNSVFSSSRIKKITHDYKPVYHVLSKSNIETPRIFLDTFLADYLLNPDQKDHSIKKTAIRYGIELSSSSKEKNKIEDDSKEETVILCKLISKKLLEEIEKNELQYLLNKIEQPLALVLANMQETGFLIDKQALQLYSKKLKNRIENLEYEIRKFLGKDININSPKQLGTALFEDLGIPVPKQSKSSSYSTKAEILESLKNYHPVIGLLLEYRTISKLESTYCTGLLNNISSDDGRIHSIFNQTETKTGRLSSVKPNLQNIPIKKDLGKEFRNFFVAEDGKVLIDADYSQIELRILAHVSEDETMIKAFSNHDDIHAIVASEIFGLPINMVTANMRNSAKVVNFGIIYGMSAYSLSKELNISKKEAEKFIGNYFLHYPKIKKYFENTIKVARETGYVETLYKRKLRLPDLLSKNFQTRTAAERLARNMPIQGTAADIMKIAMIKVHNAIKANNLESKLILQIHDELIVESPESEKDTAQKILTLEMQNAAKLSIPLTVNVGTGKNWANAKH